MGFGSRILKGKFGDYRIFRNYLGMRDTGDWKDMEYRAILVKKYLIPANIAVLLLALASGFSVKNEYIGDTFLPYVYVSSVLLVAFFLTACDYIFSVIFLIVVWIYCLGAIASTIVYFFVIWSSSCTLPICTDPSTIAYYYVQMFFGFLITGWYFIQGTLSGFYLMRYYIKLRKMLPDEVRYYNYGKKKKPKGMKIARSTTRLRTRNKTILPLS